MAKHQITRKHSIITATLFNPVITLLMKNIVFILAFLLITHLTASAAVSTSANYKVIGEVNAMQTTVLSSNSFVLGSGFIKTVYFGLPKVVLAPLITSLSPASRLNTGPININLSGANFLPGANVKLSKTGQADILATNVALVTSDTITCTFDLSNKEPGIWDIIVVNPDGKSGTLAQGFIIESQTLQVVDGEVKSSQNPFNPSVSTTSIQYSLTKDSDITLTVFNLRGEKVWERFYPASTLGGKTGLNEINWDGLTDYKSYVSFGVYILMVTTKEDGATKVLARTKIAVVK